MGVCVCVWIQLCPTLCNCMDSSPPDSSVHWILQAGILEWVAISYCRGSSQTRAQTHVSCVSCFDRWFFTTSTTWEAFAHISSVQFSCLVNPMNCSTPGLPVHHQLPEFTQTYFHRVCDAIQPSHPLLSPSLPAPNHSQHQGLFQWVNSLHEVAKVLEFQLQHQSFQWTPRTGLL